MNSDWIMFRIQIQKDLEYYEFLLCPYSYIKPSNFIYKLRRIKCQTLKQRLVDIGLSLEGHCDLE